MSTSIALLAGLGLAVITVSETFQVKGGSSLRMPTKTKNSSAKTMKRFQLIPTSQVA